VHSHGRREVRVLGAHPAAAELVLAVFVCHRPHRRPQSLSARGIAGVVERVVPEALHVVEKAHLWTLAVHSLKRSLRTISRSRCVLAQRRHELAHVFALSIVEHEELGDFAQVRGKHSHEVDPLVRRLVFASQEVARDT
jgi:hypothetical protein